MPVNQRRNAEKTPLLSQEERTENQAPTGPLWDAFQNPPKQTNVGSEAESKVFATSVKYLKIFTIFVVFCVVLVSAVVSKTTLFLMTSQIKENVTRPYCNENLDRRVQFIVTLPQYERVVWIWLLIFAFFVPELGTFLRSVRMSLFKTYESPRFWEFVALFITESLPTIGSAILIFVILPELDVVKGAMLTNAVCFVPAVMGVFSRSTKKIQKETRGEKGQFTLELILDCVCIAAQASSFVVWPLIEDKPILYCIPVAVILISVSWWENYVSKESDFKFIRNLALSKETFPNRRYLMYIFISVWKCVLFLVSVLMIFYIREGDVSFLFENFTDAFKSHSINITGIDPILMESSDYSDAITNGLSSSIRTSLWTPLIIWGINIGCSYICYAFGKFACKVLIPGFGFAFPINLTVPVVLSFLIGVTGAFNENECTYTSILPAYLFYTTPPVYFLKDFVSQQHSWIWLIWLLSQAWITIHIWQSEANNDKLSSTEKLFMKPMYDAFLIDQSVAMNRKRVSAEESNYGRTENGNSIGDMIDDNETRIYACGTMWHETREEMMEFLKSIMRMDQDQNAHKMVRKYFNKKRPDYYEFETHIFFDDAFLRKNKDDENPTINDYVKLLVEIVDPAASEIHEKNIKVRPPQLATTPYGGRLTWTLPGGTKMIAHLKDKAHIRAKKRWSQVMYMYYLLGYKLMANDEYGIEDAFTEEDKKAAMEKIDKISKNTYLLALDGDIDFQPSAVKLLVDYMKRNKTLGAACGRIHPLGSGFMAWYQVFEYAVGHWMQKATEHVIGCVLCSPGCFSLFRGSALMDHSVMAKYTTVSTEAMHYVQYDQGEDRWLCTLLLQRGYRVEYSAASDAYTHCPEGFNEFYNQRRRWMPSTIANIFDLLGDYKQTVRVNDNISTLYIFYQMILMIGTVLGPGTIFLMLVGAFVAAFKMDQWSSFWWNVVPILIYVVVSILFNSNIQLMVAAVISAAYGLVMMAVFVGVMLQISEDGFLAPSSLFFFCVAGEFIIAAIIHPKEFFCLKYGVIYYVTVPSMYMLLVIYSVFNMNNVSWGTREVTVVPQVKTDDKTKEEEKNKPKQPEHKVLSFFGYNDDNAGTMEMSIAGLVRCFWCTHKKDVEANVELRMIQESLKTITKKLEKLEQKPEGDADFRMSRTSTASKRPTVLEGSNASRKSSTLQNGTIPEEGDNESQQDDNESNGTPEVPENIWSSDGCLEKSHLDTLPQKELDFWNALIEKYLKPIDDSDKKQKIEQELKDLRDRVVTSFFMLNSLFVLVLFLLTLEKDTINVKWPINPKVNFTFIPDKNEVHMYRTYLQLEPIGFVFLIFFFLLLVIQFIAMCIHRFGTFSQIIANTSASFNEVNDNPSAEDMMNREPEELVKKVIKGGISWKSDDNDQEKKVERRKTIAHLVKNATRAPTGPYLDLEENFTNNFDKKEDLPNPENMRRKTVRFIENSRPRASKANINNV